MSNFPLEQIRLAATTVRALAIDGVDAANSGHPGMPLGMADVAVVLWSRFLKHNPAVPEWVDRDRFVLSGGHGSMLIYALLHLAGYDLALDELRRFRQWGSKTPGHPEYGHTPGVETTTGPLGQGIATAVGMAIAERHLAAIFNRDGFPVVDHRTWVMAGDGDMMEGLSHEACALAGHLKLGKLVLLYDDNQISIDGSTALAMTEDVLARFAAYGWRTLTVDGHDPEAVATVLAEAQAADDRPTLIACRTIIGYGSPNRAGTAKAHGEPLGAAEAALTKAALGWPWAEPFTVPEEAAQFMRDSAENAAAGFNAWQALFRDYAAAHPDLARRFADAMRGRLPEGWQQFLPAFPDSTKDATRNSSGKVLAALVPHLPLLVGGSADLTGSNKTWANGMGVLDSADFSGRYIHYGVREHGMAAIMNGLSVHGGIRPYGGTFLVFSDYMRGGMRLSALMHQPVIYVLTHDSIGLGEDGPTHQPIEHLMSLRMMPNMVVFRPADAHETVAGWQVALERTDGPTTLVLSRQNLPCVGQVEGALRGGYVVRDSENPQALLLATGSEVEIAVAAHEALAAQGVATRVVSLPSWELFAAQSQAYRDAVLPPEIVARVAIEAGVTLGWERFTGSFGRIIGLDHFGGSAPYQELYAQFGLTADAVVVAVNALLQ
jgi:transketolase